MAFRLPKRTEMSFPKSKPKKDKDYLSFLHELPCCVTGMHGVQAAHVSFPSPMHGSYGRGKGTKVPDAFALPLSPREHAKQHAMNEREYWAQTGVDPHALANCLFVIYSIYPEQDAIERAKARIYAGIYPSLRNTE